MKTQVRTAGSMGRGVFATASIAKGEVVEVSPCITLSKSETVHTDKTKLRWYVFAARDEDETLIALGVGSLFNHKNRYNVTYDHDPETNTIVFKAIKPIRKGAQLFIGYGYSVKKELKKWKPGV